MKITVRIPTEAYAFHEVSFDTLEEYKNEFINFVGVYKNLKVKLEDTSKNELPFETIIKNNPTILKKPNKK